jgi:hypothetical protein
MEQPNVFTCVIKEELAGNEWNRKARDENA